MRDREYYNKFKEDMRENRIEIKIDNDGFFVVTHNLLDFYRLSRTEAIGLLHILGYDYMKLAENDYRLLRRLDTYSMEELEEEYHNEIDID